MICRGCPGVAGEPIQAETIVCPFFSQNDARALGVDYKNFACNNPEVTEDNDPEIHEGYLIPMDDIVDGKYDGIILREMK